MSVGLRHVLITLAVGALGLAVVLWATRGESDLQRRVNWTIEQLQRHSPGDPHIARLKAATPESLRTPELVSARIIEQRKSALLMVNWIEAEPIADGVRLTCAETGFSCTLAIDASDRKNNLVEAKRVVCFVAGWTYAKDEAQWIALKNAVTQSHCQLVLLRQGAPSSNAMKLEWVRGGSLGELPDTREEPSGDSGEAQGNRESVSSREFHITDRTR